MLKKKMNYPYWKLTAAASFHFFFATACGFCTTSINIPASVLKKFIHQSVFCHYGINLSSFEMSWLWSATAAIFPAGAVLGSLPIGSF